MTADPLLTPQPKRVVFEEAFSLPASFSVVVESNAVPADDPGLARVREALTDMGLKEERGAPFKIRVALIAGSPSAERLLAEVSPTDALPDQEEAFFVRVTPGGAVVGGRSPRGMYYGLLTLAQWLDTAPGETVQGGWVLDWPSLQHRGIMVDPARLVEKKSYYEKVLRFLSEHKLNTLVLHLTDDPTIALRFTKHPEPADPNAWTPDEMKAFVKLAARYHVDVLPEIELFGHARGWVDHPSYADLAEPGLATLSPHNPRTYDLIRDLVDEAASIFPFPLLHAGLDEVSGPSSEEGKAFVAEDGKGRWLTDHIRKVHEMIAGNGKRMVMWGDMLLKYPGAANALPRDTIIYDWHYEPNFDDASVKWRTLMPPKSWSYFRELGFDVVACPGLMCNVRRLWPDNAQLRNTLRSAELAAEYGLLGVTATVWLPTRFLPDSVWYAYALTGAAAWAGTGFDRPCEEEAFFRHYFGIAFGEEDRRHLTFLLDNTPVWQDLTRLLWFVGGEAGYDKEFLAEGGYRIKGCLPDATAALQHFGGRASDVTRHRDEYQELVLVARVIEHLAWREKNGRAILTDPDADDLRDECRRRTREIRDAVVASWRVHRHEDYSRIKANSYGRRHVLRQDFDEALKGLDGLDDRVRVASLLQREILGSDVALTELQAFTESRVAAMPEVSSAEEWEHTAAELRRRVLDEIVFRGEAARWRQAQTHVKWLETIEGGPGYHIRKLRYEALPGLWIPALLYEPDGLAGKVPAILNVNGHEVRGKAAPYKQIRCINMAKRGMLALNVEWLGLGQLATEGFRHGHMNQLDLCGTSGLAPFYLALERALDLLLSLEHADPERIAVAGLSGGGWQTILVGSLDPRVTLANPVAGYDSYRTRARNLSDLGDSEQTPTDLAALADYTHLTALRAPRPTLLTYNDKDVYFASARALPPLLEAAEPIFALFGAEERLRTHTNSDPGDHNFEKDNREALYRALGDYFYAGQEFDAAEIPCEDELKSAGELTVPLPAETVDFHSLALELSKRLPHGRGVPEDPAALAAWQRERRRELSQLVRSKPCAVEAERVGEGRSGEFSAAFWQLHVGTEWTLPAVELVRGTPTGTVLLVADGGRSSAVSEIERLLAGGKRVIAVDPFGYGEAGTGRWHALFSLLVSSVGERTLGIEADQIAAVARWAGEQSTVVAIGPRTCLAALTATALDESTIAALELSGGLRSLHDVIDRNWSVEQAPELFCFGLLEHFDIEQLAALVAPRPVAFR